MALRATLALRFFWTLTYIDDTTYGDAEKKYMRDSLKKVTSKNMIKQHNGDFFSLGSEN